MISPNAPLPAGTLCHLGSLTVRAYAQIWPGRAWEDDYECRVVDSPARTFATRDQLDVIAQPGGAL